MRTKHRPINNLDGKRVTVSNGGIGFHARGIQQASSDTERAERHVSTLNS